MSANAIVWTVLILAILGSIVGFGFAGRRAGKNTERLNAAETALEAKDEQLDIAANRPRTPADLARRLRESGGQ